MTDSLSTVFFLLGCLLARPTIPAKTPHRHLASHWVGVLAHDELGNAVALRPVLSSRLLYFTGVSGECGSKSWLQEAAARNGCTEGIREWLGVERRRGSTRLVEVLRAPRNRRGVRGQIREVFRVRVGGKRGVDRDGGVVC